MEKKSESSKNKILTEDYPYSFANLSAREKEKLAHINEIKIFADTVELAHILKACLPKYRVYFVYIEPFRQKKSKIRSLKKLFFAQKNEIGTQKIFEEELDLGADNSVMSAIIRLDEKNVDFLTNNISSNFAFGFFVPRPKKSFSQNKKVFLSQLKNYIFEEKNAVKINIFKAIVQAVPQQLFFSFGTDKNDKEHIRIFKNEKFDFDLNIFQNANKN